MYLHIHSPKQLTFVYNIVLQSAVWSEEELSTFVSVTMTKLYNFTDPHIFYT